MLLVRITILIIRGIMNLLYSIMKLAPVKRRVVFLSRQGDTENIDFELIRRELQVEENPPEVLGVYARFRDYHDGVFKFAKASLKSMFYLATARVCVLDSYWPVVSLLKHRPELKVIQIWHSQGKIKKSGYQTLGMSSGHNKAIAEALRMHKNYDYFVTGGSAWNRCYCQAFDINESQIRNYGLPRLDLLVKEGADTSQDREAFINNYPAADEKKIVLYAPTYRKWHLEFPKTLSKRLESEGYYFICRIHQNQEYENDMWISEYSSPYKEYSTWDLLKICDCFITDYSSLAIEAAAINKKTFYYLPDNQRYLSDNGVNIDLTEIMPECTFEDEDELFEAIARCEYPDQALMRYRNEYLPKEIGNATKQIVSLIKECL